MISHSGHNAVTVLHKSKNAFRTKPFRDMIEAQRTFYFEGFIKDEFLAEAGIKDGDATSLDKLTKDIESIYDNWREKGMETAMFMPFPVVTVTDDSNASITCASILNDTDDNPCKAVITVNRVSATSDLWDNMNAAGLYKEDGAYHIVAGRLVKGQWTIDEMFTVSSRAAVTYDLTNLEPHLETYHGHMLLTGLKAFLMPAMLKMSHPAHIVLMAIDNSDKKKPKKATARARNDLRKRPVYVIRTERELQEMHRSLCGKGTVTPHIRRAHERTYRHERFTYMRGKKIKIAQMYVGDPKIAELSNKRIYYVKVKDEKGNLKNPEEET